MRRFLKPISICLLPTFLPWLTAVAGGEGLGFTTYYFSDSGENSVVTTSFNLAKKLLDKTLFLIDIELDHVASPAVTAVTGATRPQRRKDEPYEKNRGQIIVGIQQSVGESATLAGNFYRSQEVDYVSNSVVATYSQEFNDRNSTLTLRGQYGADLVGKILESGDLTQQRKKTYTGSLNLSHILSPNTVMDMSYDIVIQKGFLGDPYRQVKAFDAIGTFTLADEAHPDARTRHAAAAKLSQFIPQIKGSLLGSYRFYVDSWKVKSHTAEVKLNKYIFNDVVFGVDYRYYTQGRAYFYQDKYVGAQFLSDGFRTADYKLRAFSSNNFGFNLTYVLRGLAKSNPDFQFLQDSAVELEYFRYFNDLDFSADIIQVSIKFSI